MPLLSRRGTYATCAVNRCCLFQSWFTVQRRRDFVVESIHPQVRGIVEGRPFNVSLLRFSFFFYINYNIIYEQQITISLISFIFRFTNIEATRVISSAFKSLIEILLFQWSQISRHPEWTLQINAWFDRFEVGVNL